MDGIGRISFLLLVDQPSEFFFFNETNSLNLYLFFSTLKNPEENDKNIYNFTSYTYIFFNFSMMLDVLIFVLGYSKSASWEGGTGQLPVIFWYLYLL